MNSHKRIFIIGLPGVGKALFGKLLAEKLGWQFIDADLGMEYHVCHILDEIFGKEGQEEFYRCQLEILTALQSREHIVVATDASIVCSEGIRELLSSEFVVFLQASTSVQLVRIARNPAPLLPETDLKTFFDKLHAQRDPLFESTATVSVDTDDNAVEQHLLRVFNLMADSKKPDSQSVQLNEKDLVLFHKLTHLPVYLTGQQAVCLRLLAQGKSSKEIAREINISYRTVEGTLSKTMELLGCVSSKELIVLYHDMP